MINLNEIPDFDRDVYGQPFDHLNNKKLKTSGTIFPYQQVHIDEMLKCKKDILYFANNFYQTIHQDHGLIQIEMREYQTNALKVFKENRFSIVKYPRQSGKSTTFAVHVCHFVLFNEYKNVVILANKEKQAIELLSRIKMAYQMLPFWLQQGVVTWNKKEIELENGCKVQASSTSSDSIRGESVSLLIVDECSHVPGNIWEDFWSSIYPTISSSKTSKIILVSTPKGMNHFYKIWTLAESGENEFRPIDISWKEVPGYDEAFKKETIANTSKRKWSQEFECSFLASSNSLIDSEAIEGMPHRVPIPLWETRIYRDLIEINKNLEDLINIYELPIEGHKYSIGVDPAKITEESAGDSLAIQVLDLTDPESYKHVATVIIKNEMHYLEVPDFLNIFGRYYNEAFIFIENNDSVGQEIADTMVIDYDYDNIYSEPPKHGKANVLGFRTTVKNKKIGCLNLKMLVEKQQLMISDFDTISQISTFVKVKNSYKAEEGYSDDAVMSLIAALIFMQDRMYFEDRMKLMSKLTNKRTPKEEFVEEMPFGFGSEDTPQSPFVGGGWAMASDWKSF